MLEFHPLADSNSIFKLIEQADSQPCTWVVSDLKSKNEIQKRLLEKQGYFLESSILRASDLWKIALRRLAPQMQVVAPDFMQIVVDNFVEKFGIELQIKDSESTTLNAYVQELAPILLHPESDSLLNEWFSKQKKTSKWQRWHLLSRACIKFIIFDHEIIDQRWIAAYLQNLDFDLFVWDKNLLVDLGTEMSSVEMGLFKSLSKKINVKIIWPEPVWGTRFPLLLKTYQDHVGYGTVENVESLRDQSSSVNDQFIRVSTQLAEVKFATAQIRSWHLQGVPLTKISIISAQLEKYWPTLKYFFDEEGLIYNKDHVVRLNSLGLVQNFLSYCNNLLSEVSWESLELSLYSKQQLPDFQFENFKSIFYQLYDDSDLARDEKIKEIFYKKIDYSKKISRDEFLISAVKIWHQAVNFHAVSSGDHEINVFEVIFKDFLSRSSEVQSHFNKWLHFLQSCINSKELKIEASQSDGLQVLPLMSSHLSDSTHQIWLGNDEKSLISKKKHLIPATDIFELKTQFDFSIEYPEESFYDFNIRWLLEKKAVQKVYLCANSSFEAEPLTPSLFFLEKNSAHDLSIPEPTRHDDIQNYLAQSNFLKNSDSQSTAQYDFSDLSVAGLKRDLFSENESVPLAPLESLSPSEIEDYWKCGFKLLAQKAFRLKDLPQVAVDLDARQKGSLLHQLFEYLVGIKEKKLDAEQLRAAMHEFLDQKRIVAKIYPVDELLWSTQKSKLTQIGLTFYDFESKRRQAVHMAAEKSFELYFDTPTGEFYDDIKKTTNAIKIRGRIDRVDLSEDEVIIYDYKSSVTDLKNYSGWLENGEFQLLLYLIACDKVLYPDKLATTSLYYDYRKFDFTKGLMSEQFHSLFVANNRKKKSVITADNKQLLLKDFAVLLQELFSKLDQFEFSPKPNDVESCIRCNWSQLCRARHLN